MTIRSHAGQHPRIADDVYIDPDSVVIGDVKIGEGSSVWPMTVIRGDIHRIRIGERTVYRMGAYYMSHTRDHSIRMGFRYLSVMMSPSVTR